MKVKKTWLLGATLAATGLAYLGYRTTKKRLADKKRQALLQRVRNEWTPEEIAVVYVDPQEEAGDFSGGLVLTDGQEWRFWLEGRDLVLEEVGA